MNKIKSIGIIGELAEFSANGYDEDSLQWQKHDQEMYSIIQNIIIKLKVRTFYVNFNILFGLVFLEHLLYESNHFENMKIYLVAPYKGFEKTLTEDWRGRVLHLMEWVEVIYANEKRVKSYEEDCINKVVELSETLIFHTDIVEETQVSKTLKRAKERKKEILMYDFLINER